MDNSLNNNGQQIGFEDFLQYKNEFDDTRTLNFTSSEFFDEKKKEQRDEMYDKALYGTAGLGAAKLGYSVANSPGGLKNKINSLGSSNIMNSRLTAAAGASPFDTINPTFANPIARNISNSLQSNLMAIEELSPMHILKTLQLSSFTSLFVELADEKAQQINIGSDSIRVYEQYYRNLILNNSGYRITEADIKKGFVLDKGKLFLNSGDGAKGRELLGKASLVSTNIEIGSQNSPNRVFQKFANIHGATTNINQLKQEPLAVVGASSKKALQRDWLRSYARFSMEIGYKVLDNPLGFIEEYMTALGSGDSPVFKSEFFKKAKKISSKLQLGTQGIYTEGTRESVKMLTKNLGGKSLMAYLGYQAINATLDTITPESSVWNKGVAAGFSANYAEARVGFANMWSDNFQGYKERQEAAAEDSTKLTTLAALPLAGVMAGANAAYFQRMYDTKQKGLAFAEARHTTEKTFSGTVGKFADKLHINKPGTTLRRYSKLGGILTGALALPYLPGALIGRSSEDLAEEYSGRKEVAVRNNRGWLMGGESFEGGKIKYHRKSLIAEGIKDAKNQTLYVDGKQKRDMDPIFSPFKYLKNPYKFEEAHTDDMPYPVWGMDVTYGSFLGKAFQGTVGQIIKPDAVHPDVSNYGKGKIGLINKVLKITGHQQEDYAKEQLAAFEGITNDDAYVLPVNEDYRTKSLVEDGMMMAKASAENNTYARAGIGMHTAASDFMGMKGFAGNMIQQAAGIEPGEAMAPQLAVSGSAVTAKKHLVDMQLGDAFGAGEFLRRLIPQSSATDLEVINPMRNKVAPSWLPSNETKYFKNFQRGNFYSENQEHGETLLPSRGLEALEPSLKGIKPEDYPLAYQYKILQNVARGSSEHIATRNYLLENLDNLSSKDKEVFFEAYKQEKDRNVEKKFVEYKTAEEKAEMNILQLAQNSLWESFSHKESPLEPLTPFRPMAKFMHQRTAVEDYAKTQIAGPDTAIWTKPLDHFIKPSRNRLVQTLSKAYKPDDVTEKENIDEYFDKLALIKATRSGDTYKAQRTVAALGYTGINDAKSMRQFKNALPDNQKAYVEAFAKETNERQRKIIEAMLPDDVARGYKSIWANLDTYNLAKAKGVDPNIAIENKYIRDSKKLAKTFDIKLDSEVKENIRSNVSEGLDRNMSKRYIEMQEAKAVRFEAAQREAVEYVQRQTGKLPGDDWIGWDPRLTIDDIKLKTLTVGKADLQRFGYWSKDIRRNNRIKVLDEDTDIVNDYDQIRKSLKANRIRKEEIKRSMRKQGFEVSRVDYVPSPKGAVRIVNDKQYLEDFEE